MLIGNFIFKVASRCNLNCTYCYVYNAGDSSWRNQPKLMSSKTARRAMERVREYCDTYGLIRAVVNFHGGEPLLGGVEHLKMLSSELSAAFAGSRTHVSSAVMSNGLLFTSEIGKIMVRHDLTLFISIDGPPSINDLNRIDQRGRPSSAELERRLLTLCLPDYRRIFGGFLVVVVPQSDPKDVLDYLLSFDPPSIDFLLPLKNHNNPPEPVGAYGSWLVRCFDEWFSRPSKTRVRLFDAIMAALCGLPGAAPLGLSQSASVIVETDGTLEADDTLKTAYDGAARLGLNVFDNSFDQAGRHSLIDGHKSGFASLAEECQRCPIVKVCGGGHISHRYSKARGFNNRSVYCDDLQVLIRHVQKRVVLSLQTASRAVATA